MLDILKRVYCLCYEMNKMDIEHEQMTQRTENQVHRYPVQRPNYRCLAKSVLEKKAVTTFGRIHNADDNYYNDDDANDGDDIGKKYMVCRARTTSKNLHREKV